MESRVYPPFIHGAGRAKPAPALELPSIDEFIDELPLIDEFLADDVAEYDSANDEIRSIDEYVVDAGAVESGGTNESYESGHAVVEDETWPLADWQSYDWSRLAALGRRSAEQRAAEEEWRSTDWAGSGNSDRSGESEDIEYRATETGPSPFDVARALDEIARRIRSGELAIDQFRGHPPEAAMASALAALLRMRG
jgi:hypothetical protein